MYLKFDSVAQSLVGFLTLQVTSPVSIKQGAPTDTVGSDSSVLASPITIDPLAKGATVQTINGYVRTYYQATDGSIVEVSPSFPVSTGYSSGVLIPAGVAKANTPIAATSWGAFDEIHVYYIGTGYNNTHLREKVWKSGAGWSDGSLNGLGYVVQGGSNLLTAYHNGTTVADSTWRVTFVCGTQGAIVPASLCDAWKTSTTSWQWAYFG